MKVSKITLSALMAFAATGVSAADRAPGTTTTTNPATTTTTNPATTTTTNPAPGTTTNPAPGTTTNPAPKNSWEVDSVDYDKELNKVNSEYNKQLAATSNKVDGPCGVTGLCEGKAGNTVAQCNDFVQKTLTCKRQLLDASVTWFSVKTQKRSCEKENLALHKENQQLLIENTDINENYTTATIALTNLVGNATEWDQQKKLNLTKDITALHNCNLEVVQKEVDGEFRDGVISVLKDKLWKLISSYKNECYKSTNTTACTEGIWDWETEYDTVIATNACVDTPGTGTAGTGTAGTGTAGTGTAGTGTAGAGAGTAGTGTTGAGTAGTGTAGAGTAAAGTAGAGGFFTENKAEAQAEEQAEEAEEADQVKLEEQAKLKEKAREEAEAEAIVKHKRKHFGHRVKGFHTKHSHVPRKSRVAKY